MSIGHSIPNTTLKIPMPAGAKPPRVERQLAIPLNHVCDAVLGNAALHVQEVKNCVEALRLVIQVLQQSDRGRDGAVARIILSIAQGQTSVADGTRELRAALLHG